VNQIMTVRDFASIIIRLFGLWLLFKCLGIAQQTLASAMGPGFNIQPEYRHFFLLGNIFNLVLYGGIGIGLVWKPQLVSNRMPIPKEKDTEVRLTPMALGFVCYSVAGLVFFVIGLRGLLGYAVTMLFRLPDSYYAKSSLGSLVASGFEAAVGLVLMCRFKGVVRALRRAWLAGSILNSSKLNGKE
jgi:hypothetical protein